MNKEDQRIAIAEACGIDIREHTVADFLTGKSNIRSYELPDYLDDLNAMHEAEKTLRNQFTLQEEEYWRRLQHVEPHPIYATAAQRAEAFLKTIGKWADK